jgi:hypothetical protein
MAIERQCTIVFGIIASENEQLNSSLALSVFFSLDNALCSELTLHLYRHLSRIPQHGRFLGHGVCVYNVHIRCVEFVLTASLLL